MSFSTLSSRCVSGRLRVLKLQDCVDSVSAAWLQQQHIWIIYELLEDIPVVCVKLSLCNVRQPLFYAV